MIERKKARSGKELPERNMMRYFQLKKEADSETASKNLKFPALLNSCENKSSQNVTDAKPEYPTVNRLTPDYYC